MKTLKPIVTLVAVSMVIPELVTGNTNLFGFLNPVTLLILFLGYGVAVLLIREFFVRQRLSFFGLFILGFAYLILNEGLIAKTMIIENGIPFDVYNHYGYIFGISIPWSLFMGLWHSAYSVMFPILAVHFLFPDVRHEPWLRKKIAFTLLGVLPFLAVGAFFGPQRVVGTVGQLVLLVGSMIFFVVSALRWKRQVQSQSPVREPQVNMRPVWWGMSTFFFVTCLLSLVIAGAKMPLVVFIGAFIAGIIFYLRILKKKIGISNDTLLLFIIGGYIETALTGLLLVVFFIPAAFGERFISEMGILAVVTILARKVMQKHTSG